MRRSLLVPASITLLALPACTSGEGGGAGCGSAEGEVPTGITGLEAIGWDDGDPYLNMRTAGILPITIEGETFDLEEEPLWEGVRFDLDRPARIHAITVVWSNVDEDELSGSAPVGVGIYPDFGHNGVDYLREEPLWTGDRCGRDVPDEDPIDYVLDEPVEIGEPGLVYVAHFAELPEDPAFAFDDSNVHDPDPPACIEWADCHSAVNMPEAHPDLFYQGATLTFPWDFGVRLHVEWLEDPPADPVFAPAGVADRLWHHAAWGDYDGDGWEDLLASDRADEPQLFRNLGDGTFANVTSAAGLALSAAATAGGVWGDYDNDGCLDLYYFAVNRGRASLLLHSNCDGTFSDVTDAAGPVTSYAPDTPCEYEYPIKESAAWLDIDGDSFLDLYVANYNCGGVGSYSFDDHVFRNNGDGTFDDWTGTHGFLLEGLDGRGTAPVDYDQDGDVDLLVHDYSLHPNLFYENLGDGTVEEVAEEMGLDGEPTDFFTDTYYGHTLGAAWGDLDGDGDFDLIETNLAHPRFYHFSDRTRVLLHDELSRTFTDIASADTPLESLSGIRYRETHTVPVLGDFDADGDLDLAISQRYPGRPTDVYWGNGDGTFALDPWDAGIYVEDGWAMAAADYDHDGDLDLATRGGLFRNDHPAPGNWLQVRPIGNVRSNRSALGATVRVIAGDRVFVRYVPGSSNQGQQDTQSVHIGLGEIDVVDGIEVLFPGGRHARYDGPFPVNQHLRLREDGTFTPGW